MCYEENNLRTDIALLVARIGLGSLMLLHGIEKLSGGVVWLEQLLALNGLPAVLAYGVYLGEIVAPLLLIIGLWVRPAAFILLVNMFFAVMLVHANELFTLSPQGAWTVELQALYILGGVCLLIAGGGRFSIPCPICRLVHKRRDEREEV